MTSRKPLPNTGALSEAVGFAVTMTMAISSSGGSTEKPKKRENDIQSMCRSVAVRHKPARTAVVRQEKKETKHGAPQTHDAPHKKR